MTIKVSSFWVICFILLLCLFVTSLILVIILLVCNGRGKKKLLRTDSKQLEKFIDVITYLNQNPHYTHYKNHVQTLLLTVDRFYIRDNSPMFRHNL